MGFQYGIVCSLSLLLFHRPQFFTTSFTGETSSPSYRHVPPAPFYSSLCPHFSFSSSSLNLSLSLSVSLNAALFSSKCFICTTNSLKQRKQFRQSICKAVIQSMRKIWNIDTHTVATVSFSLSLSAFHFFSLSPCQSLHSFQ